MFNVKYRRSIIWKKENLMLVMCTLCMVVMLTFYHRDYFRSWAIGHKGIDCDYHSNIFMVETSGSSKLRPRQACAVEAAARHYPASKVNVLMFTEKPVEDGFSLKSLALNISIKTTSFEAIFSGTPLWEWYRKGEWKSSTYKLYDLSDASRICLIWKHGGLYLDLDIVSLRPLCGIKNFVVRENDELIGNSVLGFVAYHRFLDGCLQHFESNYRQGVWGSSGPILVSNTYRALCGSFVPQSNELGCNLKLLPPRIAFPVVWSSWLDYFDRWKTKEMLDLMRNSYMVHVWNKYSGNMTLSINSGTAYEEIMKDNCPTVYKQLVRLSHVDSSFVF